MLATEIIRICNAYKSREIDNGKLKELIMYYATNYPEMLFDGNTLNPTILNRIGKKREMLVNKLLKGYQHKIAN